jgi:hypothetical protein
VLPVHSCPTFVILRQGKADGVYVENGHHVSFANVTVSYEGDRSAHSWFGKCINIDGYSKDIVGVGEVTCINGP